MVPQNRSVSHILQNIFLCVQLNKNIHMFGTTWGWVNDDTIFIFGWNYLFNIHWRVLKKMFCSLKKIIN